MTEENKEISLDLIRLFVAAIQTNGEIIIESDIYSSPNVDNKRISLEISEDNKFMRVTLVDVEQENPDES